MKTKLALALAGLAAAAAIFAGGRSLLTADSSANPSRASTLLPQANAAKADVCACCVAEKAAPAATAAAPQPCCAEEKPGTPITARSLYQLEAKFTNDAGQPVQLASLRGQPVLLAMFFASCEYACPVLVSDIQRLRAELPAAVREKARVVLVTFDTVRDTPAALKAYRERMKLDDAWTLLHGDAASVQELAMLLGVKYKQDARGQFSHSNLVTVLNLEGEIAHQRAGLLGDVSEAAKAVVAATTVTIPVLPAR
jgi:protein SCO1/2